MTTSVDPRKTRESKFQEAVVQLLRFSAKPGVMFYHVPNGEHRSARTGAKLKAMGVVPGVADLAFVLDGGQSAFLELKVGNGRLSDDQKVFRDIVTAKGAWFATATDLEEARGILAMWGALKGSEYRCERAAA